MTFNEICIFLVIILHLIAQVVLQSVSIVKLMVCYTVLLKNQNPWSPYGPPKAGGWVAHPNPG